MKLLSKTNLWAGTSSDHSHLGLNYRASRKASPQTNLSIPCAHFGFGHLTWLRLKPRRATSAWGLSTLAEGTGTSPRFGEGDFGFKLASGFYARAGWTW